MAIHRGLVAIGAIALAVGANSLQPARADSAADFFRGKNIDMYIAGSAQGSYSYHVRVLSKYLTRHIPGHPNIVPQYMAGAGGIKAANYLYNVAPPDGLAVGELLKTIAINQAVGRKGVKYDTEKFGWIISTGPVRAVLALWNATTPAKTIEQAKKVQVVLGSTGKGSATYIEPKLMNDMIGTKFKIIPAYKGIDPVHLAMERGEVNGRFASWESLLCCKKDWLRKKKVILLAQSGLVRNADLPKVPTIIDLVKGEKDKAFLRFFEAATTLGRIYVTPPHISAARLAVLRKGFWDAAHDPEYIAETKNRGLEWGPTTADAAKKMALVTLRSSPEVIARARKIMGVGGGD